MIKNRSSWIHGAVLIVLSIVNLVACSPEAGQTVISKPDEYRHVFEAREDVVVKAIVRILQDKALGQNVRVEEGNRIIETDYLFQDDWRTKSVARVRKLNWKETEVLLAVITEKKTSAGWEMRRLLEKEQYERIFSVIESRIFEEMYKSE